MGERSPFLSKWDGLLGLIQIKSATWQRLALPERHLYLRRRVENGQTLRRRLPKIDEIHVQRVSFNLQLGLILRQPPKQSSPRHRHNLPKPKVESSNKIQQRSTCRRADLLQLALDLVWSVAKLMIFLFLHERHN